MPKEANGCAQKCLAEKTIGPAFGLNHVFCRSKLAELEAGPFKDYSFVAEDGEFEVVEAA